MMLPCLAPGIRLLLWAISLVCFFSLKWGIQRSNLPSKLCFYPFCRYALESLQNICLAWKICFTNMVSRNLYILMNNNVICGLFSQTCFNLFKCENHDDNIHHFYHAFQVSIWHCGLMNTLMNDCGPCTTRRCDFLLYPFCKFAV